jgi:hypothetical protein
MVCRNICEKIYSKIIVGQPHYSVGKKYCRRCECYFIIDKRFCACCGMQLRTTPVETQYKVKLRQIEKSKQFDIDNLSANMEQAKTIDSTPSQPELNQQNKKKKKVLVTA